MTNLEVRYMETVAANLPRIAKALERIAEAVEKIPAPPVTTGFDPAMWNCPLPPATAASIDPYSTALGPGETP